MTTTATSSLSRIISFNTSYHEVNLLAFGRFLGMDFSTICFFPGQELVGCDVIYLSQVVSIKELVCCVFVQCQSVLNRWFHQVSVSVTTSLATYRLGVCSD